MTAQDISPTFPFESHYLEVHGSKMHYIDEGKGDPILFLHGNPTSSYLWRNVIPHLTQYGRCIALDLIGMGKSDQPDLDYRFATHVRYVEGFIEKMGLQNITLVIHDWGSALGFHYAMRHQENVKGIAFMEAIVKPLSWQDGSFMEKMLFQWMRNPNRGGKRIIEKNFFVKRVLPMLTVRKLSDAEKAAYAAPYPDKRSRKTTAVWPQEIPIEGEPADNHRLVADYYAKLKTSPLPKLLLWAKPGMIIKGEKAAQEIKREFPNTKTVYIGKGKHFIQEDRPHEIGQAIAEWYQLPKES